MAKLSKDSSPCSLCPLWLDISSAGSPQRTQSYTENGYWSNQQPESPSRTHVSNLLVRFFLSLFARLVNVANRISDRKKYQLKDGRTPSGSTIFPANRYCSQ